MRIDIAVYYNNGNNLSHISKSYVRYAYALCGISRQERRKMKLKSKCCGAEVTVGGLGDFDDDDKVCTRYYICKSCGNACDVYEDGELTENQARI